MMAASATAAAGVSHQSGCRAGVSTRSLIPGTPGRKIALGLPGRRSIVCRPAFNGQALLLAIEGAAEAWEKWRISSVQSSARLPNDIAIYDKIVLVNYDNELLAASAENTPDFIKERM